MSAKTKTGVFACSLRISHPTIPVEKITEAMGISPKAERHAGALGPTRNMNGNLVRNDETLWIADVGSGEYEDLDSLLCRVAIELSSKGPFLRELAKDGGQSEIFIGYGVDLDTGEELRAETLRKMGDLELNLSICLYPKRREVK